MNITLSAMRHFTQAAGVTAFAYVSQATADIDSSLILSNSETEFSTVESIPVYEPHYWNDLERVVGELSTDPFDERRFPDAAELNANIERYKTFLEERYPDMLETQGSGIYFYYTDQAHQIIEFPPEELSQLWGMDIDRTQKFISDFYSFWGSLQTSSNCYSYAVNDTNYTVGTKINPGESSGFIAKDNTSFSERIIQGAESDGLINAGSSLPNQKSGFYRVVLFTMEQGDENDFHWLRENPDGTWSGKFGHAEVSNLDMAGDPILTPETAMMTNALGERYEVASYFYVPSTGIDLFPDVSINGSRNSHKNSPTGLKF